MPDDVTLSIVIPAYNEEKRLPRTLALVAEFLAKQNYTSEIIVVTDGSKDATAEVARNFKKSFEALKVLEFPANKGKGFSVREGMLEARGAFRLFMDADYAVPVDYVPAFMERMVSQKLDILIASRSAKGASFEQSQPFMRQMLAQLFGVLQKAVLRLPFTDTQCGFKMFTAAAAAEFFPQIKYECAYFDAELLYIAHKAGAKIGEYGVTWRHDNETRLPIGPARSLDLLRKLLRIKQTHAAVCPTTKATPVVKVR